MSSRVAASGPPDHGRPDMALAGRPPDIGGAAPPDILRGACMHECACRRRQDAGGGDGGALVGHGGLGQ